MTYYAKLIVVILIVLALAQFAPKAINVLLGLILAGMLVMQSDKYSALIAQLKL